jgi:S-methylmethionine-dependent homocysteine/selenocysteine methylase
MTEATSACTAGLESGKPVWVALTVHDTKAKVLRSGESIIGGCCEIGPAHINAVHERLKAEGFM